MTSMLFMEERTTTDHDSRVLWCSAAPIIAQYYQVPLLHQPSVSSAPLRIPLTAAL